MAAKAIIKLGTVKNANLSLRFMSQQPKNKGFLGGLMDNIKEEFNKNKEMKDTIKKFREEAKKLEESDALKEVKKKYKLVEDQKDSSSKILKEKLGEISEKVKDSELTKKAVETSGKVFKAAQEAAQDISKTDAMKKVSENVKVIGSKIDDVAQISSAKLYRPPKELRKRTEVNPTEQKVYESNDKDQEVVLHKDSKWSQSWSNFKDNNPYVNKLFELKAKYDESDNTLVRASRVVTDRFLGIFGSVFKTSEMSEVLTEITKMDPNFDINEFHKFVQNEIIPNVLESWCREEFEILKDWCTDTAYTQLTHPMEVAKQFQTKCHFKVLDISNLEIVNGKMFDQGPILIVSFNSQQVMYVTDLKGKIVEGSKDKVKSVVHVWGLCRDQTIVDPKNAWRLMECTHQVTSDIFV